MYFISYVHGSFDTTYLYQYMFSLLYNLVFIVRRMESSNYSGDK